VVVTCTNGEYGDGPGGIKPGEDGHDPESVAKLRLVELFDKYQPQVVVTYDENGGYPHPDHIHTHRITMAAFEKHPVPSKVYYSARRRRDFARIRELLAEQGVELPQPPAPATPPDPAEVAAREAEMERREARITTEIDVSAFVEQKRAALAAHGSQLDNSWWLRFPPEAMAILFANETFIRAHDMTGAPTPETDLFAGLR
jgi:LmbE family N-acetylglucosaminyl deacetylase